MTLTLHQQILLNFVSMGNLLGSSQLWFFFSPCSCSKQATRFVEDTACKRGMHAAGAVSCALRSTQYL